MRKLMWRVYAITLLSVLVLVPIAPFASAHPASSVVCSYDFVAQELSVTITHNVGDPTNHYIDWVELSKDSVLIDTYVYTTQPGNTFTYVYQISAQNGDVLSALTHCNEGGTRSGQVTVQGLPLDITDPAITIILPVEGTMFDISQITVAGTASDETGLQKVEVRVGAGTLRLATGTSSWSVSLNLATGSNTITAMATDLAGNTATHQVTVGYTPSAIPDTVAPAISITNPSSGTIFNSSELTVQGTASDDIALAIVEYRLNGGSGIQASGTASFSFQVRLEAGLNTIEVTAIDSSGNNATASIEVTYVPPTRPPEISIWLYHAAFLVLGLVFMLIAIPIVRMKRKNWLKIHRALGILAATMVAIGFSIGVYMTGGRFSGTHGIMGLIATIMTFAEPVLGFAIFKAKKKENIRLVHKWLGRITPVIMVVVILLGLSLVGLI